MMAKRVLSDKQPKFRRQYELLWECPECGVDNGEEEPGESARPGDVFQCNQCEALFVVSPPNKTHAKRKAVRK